MKRIVVVLALGACSGTKPLCEVPPSTTYECEPLPAGTYGCVGGPVWRSQASDAIHQDDPAAVFPNGCKAHIPDCSPEYMGSTRVFECIADGSDPAVWAEAL